MLDVFLNCRSPLTTLLQPLQNLDLGRFEVLVLTGFGFNALELAEGATTGETVFGLDAIAGNVKRSAGAADKVVERVGFARFEILLDDEGRGVTVVLGAIGPLDLDVHFGHGEDGVEGGWTDSVAEGKPARTRAHDQNGRSLAALF